ncbi:putative cyclin-dependent kinase F-2 [Setaria italica]|nr:putative cyclin-dependent kinase F-2 [Setaria italica]
MAELLAGAPLFPGRSEMDQLNRVFDTLGMQDMASWPGFARLPRAGSGLCHRARPPSRLREMFPALSAAGFDVLSGLLSCRPDRRLAAADALRCPWFADAPAAAPEAMPADQLRASCAAAMAASVPGVAEAIIA